MSAQTAPVAQIAELHDRTAQCIRCGFCLEACPTFVLTGQETESPRGRIYLVRSAIEGKLNWDRAVQDHLDTCLGCRACEPACPSGVQYGSILETAREQLERRPLRGFVERWARRALLRTLTSPARLRAAAALLRLVPGRRLPWLVSAALTGRGAEVEKPRPETGGGPIGPFPKAEREVYFLQGCAMRVLYPQTNSTTVALLRRHACEVLTPGSAGCCGALLTHYGDADAGRWAARRLIDALPGEAPVITNSAGCGSAMKEYGRLLQHDAVYAERAAGFAGRVRDITEFLEEVGFRPPPQSRPRRIAYHDACHLAHGQGVREQPRRLLASLPSVVPVALEESDRCCGSAGVYNLTQPHLARELLERKWRFIEASGADTVVTGNPGCLAWIQQAAREKKSRIRVIHTAVALAGE